MTQNVPEEDRIALLESPGSTCGSCGGNGFAVLNNTPASFLCPKHERSYLGNSPELDYRPDFFARSLRGKRTFTIGVIAEVEYLYSSILLKGIEEHLGKHGFFFLRFSSARREGARELFRSIHGPRSRGLYRGRRSC